jgi:putative ABC transport system permease protein
MRRSAWWIWHLERRSEIGLRRAVGATKGNILAQFPAEAILLATASVGPAAAAFISAAAKGWAIVMSAWPGAAAWPP